MAARDRIGGTVTRPARQLSRYDPFLFRRRFGAASFG